jgi:uncharacterized protein YprB with RNaseH-like and TPR domain
MLINTFLHLPGVGEKTEQRVWASGIHCWADALLAASTHPSWRPLLEESLRHLNDRNPGYFAGLLPSNQQWRLYRDFSGRCAFVDIETTGLGVYSAITTIALYDGVTLRTYVRGQNLDQFARDIADYHLLVTFNGKSFDVPILERGLGARMPKAHVDLRHVLRGLGLRGGLKNVERQLGMERPGLHEVDGSVAVLLWEEYQRRGNLRALETLLAYNAHDVINLHALAVHAHNEYLKKTPFGPRHRLETPVLPEVPFQPDATLVERFTRMRYSMGVRWSS